MAESSFSLIAEDDLTCPVCFELLRDPNTPKLLDCPHVCCVVCIQMMIEGGRRIVDCPECRQVTRIPEEGVTAMKTVLRVRSLAEKHEEHRSKKSQATSPVPMCPDHNIIIDFYCEKCNVTGCSSCMVYKHKGPEHNFHSVKSVHKDQNEYMATLFDQADSEIEECKQSVEQLESLQAEIESSMIFQCETVQKQVELVIKAAEEEGQTLINNLKKNEISRMICVEQEKTRLQTQIQEAIGVVTAAKNTLETTKNIEYVVKHNKVIQTVISALGKDIKGKVNRNPAIGLMKYVHERPLDVKGNLGKTLQLRELKCELIEEFGEFKFAACVAVSPNGLLAVNDFNDKQVYIYRQQKNNQYKKHTSLALSSKNTKERPFDVATTAESKYLVARDTHVEVYSPSSKYEGTLHLGHDCWKEGNKNAYAHGITCMPDGRILVANVIHPTLTILSEKETILDIIPTSITPRRTAVMTHGHIAVGNWMAGKVCVIDLESRKEVQSLDIPLARGLCYDEETDCLLVGRCVQLDDDGFPKTGTGVIEQYCSTTRRLVACIAEGLYFPQDLTLTPNGMLAVADGKTVKIYKIVEK